MNPYSPITSIINQYISAFPDVSFRVVMVRYLSDGSTQAQNRYWTANQLQKGLTKLQSSNAQGEHIYARPDSYQYILLDDITPEVLPRVYAALPCLVMETSPKNYQSFFYLAQMPKSEEEATAWCRYVANYFGGDRGSADALHVGRLPGFTNRKEKHRMPNGHYPFVKLLFAKQQVSLLSPPSGGLCFSSEPQAGSRRSPQKIEGRDRSREDFALACHMVRRGSTDEEIFTALSQREKGQNRPKYVRMTVRNAWAAVARQNQSF